MTKNHEKLPSMQRVNPILHDIAFEILYALENIMENQAFAQRSKFSNFHNILKSIQNLNFS